MKRRLHRKSCSCTNCVYRSRSELPSVQGIIQTGSKIDKLYYGKYLPLRERKLLQKLIRTRAVYDDVRTQLLSASEDDTLSVQEDDSTERSSAVVKLVDLVDRGQIGSRNGSKLSNCCSCCECKSFKNLKADDHPLVHIHSVPNEAITEYTKEANRRAKARRKKLSTKLSTSYRNVKLKAKRIKSAPCTCTFGLFNKTSKLKSRKSTEEESVKTSISSRTDKVCKFNQFKKCYCRCKFAKRLMRKIAPISEKEVITGGFRIKKDSKMLYTENLKKKRLLKKLRRQPGVCVSGECLVNVKSRAVTFKEKTSNKISGSDLTTKNRTHRATRIKKRTKNIKSSQRVSKSDSKSQTSIFSLEKNVSAKMSGQTPSFKLALRRQKRDKPKMKSQELTEILTREHDKIDKKHNKNKGTNKIHKLGSDKNIASFNVDDDNFLPSSDIQGDLPFPRECDPNMCVPNECNPFECAKLLLSRSSAGNEQDTSVEHLLQRGLKNRSTSSMSKSSQADISQTNVLKYKHSSEQTPSFQLAIAKKKKKYPMLASNELMELVKGEKSRGKASIRVKQKKKRIKSNKNKTNQSFEVTKSTSQTDVSASKTLNKNDKEKRKAKKGEIQCLCPVMSINVNKDHHSQAVHAGSGDKLKNKLTSTLLVKPQSEYVQSNAIKNKQHSNVIENKQHSNVIENDGRYIRNKQDQEEMLPIEMNTHSTKDVVRIGSSLNFNIEFYKDKLGTPEFKEKDIRMENVTQRIQKYPLRNTKERRGGGRKQFRRMSSQSMSMKSNATSTGRSLKRCFCVLKIPKKKVESSKWHMPNKTEAMATYRSKVVHVTPSKTNRSHLLPYECEPFYCTPGECDPYECAKRIRWRRRKEFESTSKGVGTEYGNNRLTHTSASQSKKGTVRVSKRLRERDIGTEHGTNRSTYTSEPQSKKDKSRNQHKIRKPKNDFSDYQDLPLESYNNSRQVVRIGSTFSFNIEFSKQRINDYVDSNETQNSVYDYPRNKKQRHRGTSHYHPRLRHTLSQTRRFHKSKRTLTDLKRCFCTLNLFKAEGTETPLPQTDDSGIMMTHEKMSTVRGRDKRGKYYRDQGTPCEPGECVPGECDPYECLKRKHRKNQTSRPTNSGAYQASSKENYARRRHRKTRSTISDTYQESSNAAMQRIKAQQQRVESPKLRQAVRVGSSFSFNIDFYKDQQSDNDQYSNYRRAWKVHESRNKNAKHKRRGTQESLPSQSNIGTGPNRNRSHNKGISAIKRCFCTLGLLKGNKNTQKHGHKNKENKKITDTKNVPKRSRTHNSAAKEPYRQNVTLYQTKYNPNRYMQRQMIRISSKYEFNRLKIHNPNKEEILLIRKKGTETIKTCQDITQKEKINQEQQIIPKLLIDNTIKYLLKLNKSKLQHNKTPEERVKKEARIRKLNPANKLVTAAFCKVIHNSKNLQSNLKHNFKLSTVYGVTSQTEYLQDQQHIDMLNNSSYCFKRKQNLLDQYSKTNTYNSYKQKQIYSNTHKMDISINKEKHTETLTHCNDNTYYIPNVKNLCDRIPSKQFSSVSDQGMKSNGPGGLHNKIVAKEPRNKEPTNFISCNKKTISNHSKFGSNVEFYKTRYTNKSNASRSVQRRSNSLPTQSNIEYAYAYTRKRKFKEELQLRQQTRKHLQNITRPDNKVKYNMANIGKMEGAHLALTRRTNMKIAKCVKTGKKIKPNNIEYKTNTKPNRCSKLTPSVSNNIYEKRKLTNNTQKATKGILNRFKRFTQRKVYSTPVKFGDRGLSSNTQTGTGFSKLHNIGTQAMRIIRSIKSFSSKPAKKDLPMKKSLSTKSINIKQPYTRNKGSKMVPPLSAEKTYRTYNYNKYIVYRSEHWKTRSRHDVCKKLLSELTSDDNNNPKIIPNLSRMNCRRPKTNHSVRCGSNISHNTNCFFNNKRPNSTPGSALGQRYNERKYQRKPITLLPCVCDAVDWQSAINNKTKLEPRNNTNRDRTINTSDKHLKDAGDSNHGRRDISEIKINGSDAARETIRVGSNISMKMSYSLPKQQRRSVSWNAKTELRLGIPNVQGIKTRLEKIFGNIKIPNIPNLTKKTDSKDTPSKKILTGKSATVNQPYGELVLHKDQRIKTEKLRPPSLAPNIDICGDNNFDSYVNAAEHRNYKEICKYNMKTGKCYTKKIKSKSKNVCVCYDSAPQQKSGKYNKICKCNLKKGKTNLNKACICYDTVLQRKPGKYKQICKCDSKKVKNKLNKACLCHDITPKQIPRKYKHICKCSSKKVKSKNTCDCYKCDCYDTLSEQEPSPSFHPQKDTQEVRYGSSISINVDWFCNNSADASKNRKLDFNNKLQVNGKYNGERGDSINTYQTENSVERKNIRYKLPDKKLGSKQPLKNFTKSQKSVTSENAQNNMELTNSNTEKKANFGDASCERTCVGSNINFNVQFHKQGSIMNNIPEKITNVLSKHSRITPRKTKPKGETWSWNAKAQIKIGIPNIHNFVDKLKNKFSDMKSLKVKKTEIENTQSKKILSGKGVSVDQPYGEVVLYKNSKFNTDKQKRFDSAPRNCVSSKYKNTEGYESIRQNNGNLNNNVNNKHTLEGTCVCPKGSFGQKSTCRCPKRPIVQKNTCLCPKYPIVQKNRCRCRKSPIVQKNTCRCPKSPIVQKNTCRCPKSPNVQQNTCVCSKSSMDQKNTCLCPKSTIIEEPSHSHYRYTQPEQPFRCGSNISFNVDWFIKNAVEQEHFEHDLGNKSSFKNGAFKKSKSRHGPYRNLSSTRFINKDKKQMTGFQVTKEMVDEQLSRKHIIGKKRTVSKIDPNSKPLRVGSNISFNVQFYKQGNLLNDISEKLRSIPGKSPRQSKSMPTQSRPKCSSLSWNAKTQINIGMPNLQDAGKKVKSLLGGTKLHSNGSTHMGQLGFKHSSKSVTSRKPYGNIILYKSRMINTDKTKQFQECSPNNKRKSNFSHNKTRPSRTILKNNSLMREIPRNWKDSTLSERSIRLQQQNETNSKAKQTVRFGSNISFNIEFYRDDPAQVTVPEPVKETKSMLSRQISQVSSRVMNNSKRTRGARAKSRRVDIGETSILERCICKLKRLRSTRRVYNSKSATVDIRNKNNNRQAKSETSYKHTQRARQGHLKSRTNRENCHPESLQRMNLEPPVMKHKKQRNRNSPHLEKVNQKKKSDLKGQKTEDSKEGDQLNKGKPKKIIKHALESRNVSDIEPRVEVTPEIEGNTNAELGRKQPRKALFNIDINILRKCSCRFKRSLKSSATNDIENVSKRDIDSKKPKLRDLKHPENELETVTLYSKSDLNNNNKVNVRKKHITHRQTLESKSENDNNNVNTKKKHVTKGQTLNSKSENVDNNTVNTKKNHVTKEQTLNSKSENNNANVKKKHITKGQTLNSKTEDNNNVTLLEKGITTQQTPHSKGDSKNDANVKGLHIFNKKKNIITNNEEKDGVDPMKCIIDDEIVCPTCQRNELANKEKYGTNFLNQMTSKKIDGLKSKLRAKICAASEENKSAQDKNEDLLKGLPPCTCSGGSDENTTSETCPVCKALKKPKAQLYAQMITKKFDEVKNKVKAPICQWLGTEETVMYDPLLDIKLEGGQHLNIQNKEELMEDITSSRGAPYDRTNKPELGIIIEKNNTQILNKSEIWNLLTEQDTTKDVIDKRAPKTGKQNKIASPLKKGHKICICCPGIKRHKKEDDITLSHYGKPRPCICGSADCSARMKALEKKQQRLQQKVLLKKKPCLCGSKVCEMEVELERKILIQKMKEEKLKEKEMQNAGKNKKQGAKGKQKKKGPDSIKSKSQKQKEAKAKKLKVARQKAKRKVKIKLDKIAAKHRASREIKYSHQDAKIREVREKENRKRAKLIKKHKNSDFLLAKDSLSDVLRVLGHTAYGTARGTFRAVRDPIRVKEKIKYFVKHPRSFVGSLKTTLSDTGIAPAAVRIGKRIARSSASKVVKEKLESNKAANYLIHMSDKDPRKRLQKLRPVKRVREPLDFQCGLFIATLSKRPHWSLYFSRPWFYPHWVYFLRMMKQAKEMIYMTLALVFWTPCVVCVEGCRAFVCCFLCTE